MSRITGGRRRRNRRGRRSRRSCHGGNPLAQAVVPFGLFGLSNYLGRGKRHGSTKKGDYRKTSRRAYMTRRGTKLF